MVCLLKYFIHLISGIAFFTTGFVVYHIWLRPPFYFPKPTGQYSVGTTSYQFKDESRKETHSENSTDKRKLMIQIWYPAKGKKQLSEIPYDSEPCIEMLKIERGIPQKQLQDLKKIYTFAHQGIPPENSSKYPVILFSPDFCCPRINNTANCEELASHGYIVIGIDPTYASAMVKFSDGQTIKGKDIKILEQDVDNKEQQIWVEDTIFVLDQLEKLNKDIKSPLYGMFNLDKIGIFGRSYGGSTAAQLCRLDKRCKAGVSLDGGLFGKNSTEQFDKPFMFIMAQDWPWAHMTKEDLKQINVTKEQFENIKKKWLEYIPALCNAIGQDTYQIKIKNTKHNDFSDSTLIKEISSLKSFNLDVGTINGFRTTEIVNAYLLNFFNKYLKNQSSNFLNNENKPYPEIETK